MGPNHWQTKQGADLVVVFWHWQKPKELLATHSCFNIHKKGAAREMERTKIRSQDHMLWWFQRQDTMKIGVMTTLTICFLVDQHLCPPLPPNGSATHLCLKTQQICWAGSKVPSHPVALLMKKWSRSNSSNPRFVKRMFWNVSSDPDGKWTRLATLCC